MTLETLAYVFWHRPRPGVPTAEYETTLRTFHARLAGAGIAGFDRSWSARLDSIPWLDGLPGYEDRYLISDFTALGALNAAAPQQPGHDAAASRAADGIAGIYRLIRGTADPAATGSEWLSKSDGVSYPEYLAGLEIGGGALWQRQMTLGPTPEFQLIGGPTQSTALAAV